MDSTQILLIAVVIVLTILLTIVGIQVFFILREIRETIKKFNKIMEDAGIISESIAKPLNSLSSSIIGVSGIAGFLSWLRSRGKKTTEEKEKKEKDE